LTFGFVGSLWFSQLYGSYFADLDIEAMFEQTNINGEFSGQVAVVSGSSSGIGKALAAALGARGATLCLLGRNLDRLERVKDEICAAGNRARCYRVDLTRDADIEDLHARMQNDFGGVDILVHSAGVFSLGGVQRASAADFDLQYQTNLRAVFSLTQALLPLLKARQGQLVFINSTAGLIANASAVQYSVTKHALKALADCLRKEVNADGLRVLSVFLGRSATPLQAQVHASEGKVYQPERLVQPEDVASVVVNALSLPRTAEVTDLTIRPLIKPR
jgi:NADP-dependent 3-hydroxy acid dehydrogenase YdfG